MIAQTLLEGEKQIMLQLKSRVTLPILQQKKETVLVTPQNLQLKQDQEELKFLL